MPTKFISAVDALQDAHKRFKNGEASPVMHSNLRQSALVIALTELAEAHDVKLQLPLGIDSNGEFSLVAMPADGSSPQNGCGRYGDEFADLLNGYQPRTGTWPGATMLPESGYCKMNHFEVERMIVDVANKLAV